MNRLRRVARPALEQSIQLLKECSDWNPALKSAAGGLAYILSTIRLSSENRATCQQLLMRILDIACDLANQPQDTASVRSRLARFERCLLDLGAKLQQCHESGAITALMRARRDATVLHDCESELNAACLDMQLFLGLTGANRNDQILAALKRNEIVLHSIEQKQSEVQDHIASRTELFSVLGRRCALVQRLSGERVIEADASIVLFA